MFYRYFHNRITSSELKQDIFDLQQLHLQYQNLRGAYQKILPKVDPDLIDDLLLREKEDPDTRLMYTLDVFRREGIDTKVGR